MIYIDEIKDLKLYKRAFLLPRNGIDKKKGNVIMLLTPNYESSMKLLKNPLMKNKYYRSYYLEKDVSFYINNESGSLSTIENEDYIHEEVEGENGTVLNEGIYSHYKERIIYNGYANDVAKVKQFINMAEISNCRNTFDVSPHYPISVTAYRNRVPAPTDAKSINVVANMGISDLDYAFYCREEIYTMLIKTLNPNVDPTILEPTVMVLAGTYDKFKNTLSTKQPYTFQCIGIKNILADPHGDMILKNIIKKNDIKELAKWCAKSNPYITKIMNIEEAGKPLTPLGRIKRYIHFTSGGRRNLVKKVKDNVEDTIDPTEENPDFEIKNIEGTNYEEDRHDDDVQVPTIDYRRKPSAGSASAPESNNEYTLFDGFTDEYYFNEEILRTQDVVTYFTEEGTVNNAKLRKMLYKERIRTNKQLFAIYEDVKAQNKNIQYTFINIARYKNKNLIVDLRYYNELFFKNNMYKMQKGLDLYYTLLVRLINNGKLTSAGYTKERTVFIPIQDWDVDPKTKMWMYTKDINPVSLFYRLMQKDMNKLRESFGNTNFVFITDKAYFKVNFNKMKDADRNRFLTLVRKLRSNDSVIEDEGDTDVSVDSKQAIVDTIVDDIEDKTTVKISYLTGKKTSSTKEMVKKDDNFKSANLDKEVKEEDIQAKENEKKELVKKIEDVADKSTSVDDALEQLDQDDYFKKILDGLSSEESNGLEINNSRKNRMDKLSSEALTKKVQGKTVQDILAEKESYNSTDIPATSLPIDSVNPEWGELVYLNSSNYYDPNDDIVSMLYDLKNKSYPITIRDINVEDTSTSEDYIYTYDVDLENHEGKRFKIKFDVPKLINNQYMLLRGNNKVISSQSTLMPILKTEPDTVQIVSNYNKIFIRRYGSNTGKSCVYVDRLIKTINKYGNQMPNLKVTTGSNERICNRYDLPIDYIDLASVYTYIETPARKFYFDQEELRNELKTKYKDKYDKITPDTGVIIGIDKQNKDAIIWNKDFDCSCSEWILDLISMDIEKFEEFYNTTSISVKYTYAKASILNTDIPVVVIAGYLDGLTKTLQKAGIKNWQFVEKRPAKAYFNKDCVIKFSDGYLIWDDKDNSASILMNGLKESPTQLYSVADVNNKSMWLDFLDNYGGKIKSDGIDNFKDCMIDPITVDILKHYDLPTDFVELLCYSTKLLTDNAYYKHGDMAARRIRKNEIIAGYAYKALSAAYGSYATMLRHGRGTVMTIKKSAIIDLILKDPTSSDSSFLNPLAEIESFTAVSTKGLSGMNNDRSYSLDKRSYDESMINVFGMSTNFAGTVGIGRQMTINANVNTARGYVQNSSQADMNSVNSLCFTEALNPMGTTRDDPFRTAMTYVQTSKHGMRVKSSNPCLITNGASAALPYVISDNFAHKAKDNGEVTEFVDNNYMIIKYDNGDAEYVDISEKIEKNSAAGFYQVIKLDTDLKKGSKVKKGKIVAYDKLSFNPNNGANNDLEYNIGPLVKCAMLDTDEGFEDSAIISDALSEALSSDMVVKKEVNLPKTTNVYKLLEPGTPIQEGDTLMIMQSPFDEEDANALLKTLVDDPEEISNLGRIHINSKVTGVLQDIEIYRTVELDELSDSLKKICKKYESKVKAKKSVLNKYGVIDPSIGSDYKLDATGKLKGAADGVQIVFYLKYTDKMSVGDKLVYWSANKGVVKGIFPKGKEPYFLSEPNEKLHTLVSISAINGRMVASIQNVGITQYLLVEATKKAKDMAGIKYDYNIID